MPSARAREAGARRLRPGRDRRPGERAARRRRRDDRIGRASSHALLAAAARSPGELEGGHDRRQPRPGACGVRLRRPDATPSHGRSIPGGGRAQRGRGRGGRQQGRPGRAGPCARRSSPDTRRSGIRSITSSAREGIGVEELDDRLVGRVSVVTGPSGVGKSTLLNAIQPGLRIETGAVSEAVHKGRHTTTSAELHALTAPVAATWPTRRGCGSSASGRSRPEELAWCFPEIEPWASARSTTAATFRSRAAQSSPPWRRGGSARLATTRIGACS